MATINEPKLPAGLYARSSEKNSHVKGTVKTRSSAQKAQYMRLLRLLPRKGRYLLLRSLQWTNLLFCQLTKIKEAQDDRG